MEDTMSQETGVTVDSSTPADSSPSPAESTQGAQSQEAATTSTESANIPFHQHPRWKEVIGERDTWKTKYSEMEQRLAQMQEQMQQVSQRVPEKQDPRKQLLQELKEIRPEFGELIEDLDGKASKYDTLAQEIQALKAEREREAVQSTMSSLFSQYKVPENQRKHYQAHLRAAAIENPKLGVRDLPGLFSQIHESLSKDFSEYEKSIRSSYVTEKKQDASTPVTQKGAPAPSKPDSQSKPMSREEQRAMIVAAMREGKKTI